jgi:protein dithiol oxidoreductase (disulfide-forming)
MKRSIGLLILMTVSVTACGREQSRSADAEANAKRQATEQPSSTPQSASPSTPQSETQQATAAQESSGEATAAEDPGDATLERLAALPATQQLPSGRWKAGTNYDPIVPAQPTNVGPGKVEVMEVFWYGCPHCFALEPYMQSWIKNKPDFIQLVRVPVMWGPAHRAHARLFYTLEALGRQDLHQKVFDTLHGGSEPLYGKDDASTLVAQLSWAKRNGIDAQAFTQAYNSFTVNSNLSRAEDLTKRYRIEGVPFLAVNGKYGTDVGKAGGPSNLIQLLNDLATSERPR